MLGAWPPGRSSQKTTLQDWAAPGAAASATDRIPQTKEPLLLLRALEPGHLCPGRRRPPPRSALRADALPPLVCPWNSGLSPLSRAVWSDGRRSQSHLEVPATSVPGPRGGGWDGSALWWGDGQRDGKGIVPAAPLGRTVTELSTQGGRSWRPGAPATPPAILPSWLVYSGHCAYGAGHLPPAAGEGCLGVYKERLDKTITWLWRHLLFCYFLKFLFI